VTLCFKRYLYRSCEACSLLINASAETSSPQLGTLTLKVADVGLEVITLSHLDGEEVMVVLLGLSARGVLSEERFCYHLKILERAGSQRVEPI